MADPVKPAQAPSQSVAGQGGIGPQGNPQNLNQSPSPGGDGIQSAASEKAAAGDTGISQPAQQRINAAERRERGENAKPGDKAGLRPSLIQSPGIVDPGTVGAEAINGAEQARLNQAEQDHLAANGEIPQATLDEIEAGKAALKRHAHPAKAPTNPVDDLNDRKSV